MRSSPHSLGHNNSPALQGAFWEKLPSENVLEPFYEGPVSCIQTSSLRLLHDTTPHSPTPTILTAFLTRESLRTRCLPAAASTSRGKASGVGANKCNGSNRTGILSPFLLQEALGFAWAKAISRNGFRGQIKIRVMGSQAEQASKR